MSETINLSNGIQLVNMVSIGYARRKQILVDLVALIAGGAAEEYEAIILGEKVQLPKIPSECHRITLLQLITHGKDAALRGRFDLEEGRVVDFAIFVSFKSAGKDEIIGLEYFD